MTIELMTEVFCLFVEVFDERVDIVFAARAVEAALIERRIQAGAKMIGLLFYATNNLLNVFVVYAIGLADDLSIRNGSK
jgi:hypothetical protein